MTKESKLAKLSWYSRREERLNIYTHALGIILSIMGGILLLIKSLDYSFLAGFSIILYAISQILIFSASTLYHAQTQPNHRAFWNIIDHAMIYVSIAGTYTPFCLITLQKHGGLFLFAFVWTCALIGVLLKIKFTGKYNLLSTLMYLAMGWVIVFYWSDISSLLPQNGIHLLILGGLSYTVGAVIYMIHQIPYNHALFHLFILIGAISHFCSIYFFL